MKISDRLALVAIADELKAKAEKAARIGDKKYEEALALEESGCLPAELVHRRAEQSELDELSEAFARFSLTIEGLVEERSA